MWTHLWTSQSAHAKNPTQSIRYKECLAERVASHPPGAGRIVPLVAPGVGVVAMQGMPAPKLREATMRAMATGAPPVKALEMSLTPDARREDAQHAGRLEQLAQGLWPMDGEDRARAGLRVARV